MFIKLNLLKESMISQFDRFRISISTSAIVLARFTLKVCAGFVIMPMIFVILFRYFFSFIIVVLTASERKTLYLKMSNWTTENISVGQ